MSDPDNPPESVVDKIERLLAGKSISLDPPNPADTSRSSSFQRAMTLDNLVIGIDVAGTEWWYGEWQGLEYQPFLCRARDGRWFCGRSTLDGFLTPPGCRFGVNFQEIDIKQVRFWFAHQQIPEPMDAHPDSESEQPAGATVNQGRERERGHTGHTQKLWVTVTEAATVAGVDKGAISRAVEGGKLKGNGERGRLRRIDSVDLTRWILERSHRSEPAESDEYVKRRMKQASPK